MRLSIKIKLLAFALGAFILVIGDYLYGTTYYTNIPTSEPNRFLISGILGFVTAVLYVYGSFGYAEGFTKKDSIFRKLTLAGLGVFSVGVAVTHSLAAAYMYILNAKLLHPNDANIEVIFIQVENCYNTCFIPSILGLLVGFVSLLIGALWSILISWLYTVIELNTIPWIEIGFF